MKKLKVLVACEYSGIVRDAFTKLGHIAWSCDLLPSEKPGNHIEGDVFLQTDLNYFDLLIAHPPCTHLTVAGARWFKNRQVEQKEAIDFFMKFINCGVKHIAVENPISIMSTRYRKPDQIVQPWWFGHPETKSTCLWLKNLPKLVPTNDVREKMLKLPLKERTRVHYASPGPNRWKERSRTLVGIANAFADQWSKPEIYA